MKPDYKTHTLPAISHAGLSITVKDTGELVSMAWDQDDKPPADKQDEIVALEKAKLFHGGRLYLPLLVQRLNETKAAHNVACGLFSTFEEREGVNCESPSQERLDAEKAMLAAGDSEERAKAWLSLYPATTGKELALMVSSMLSPDNLVTGLSYEERKALKDCAWRVVTGMSVETYGGAHKATD